MAVMLPAIPAWAADCPILQQLNAMPMSPAPGGLRMLVPVTIDGAVKQMLLGTASGLTTLNAATVSAMDLSSHDSDARLLDSEGNVSRRYVHVKSLAMGNMKSGGADFMITPDRNAGASPPNDGVFAAMLAAHYDVEMDFAHGKLNYFSPEHCDGHVIYWPATMVGVAPIVIRKRTDSSTREGGFQQALPQKSGIDLGQSGGSPSAVGGGTGETVANPSKIAASGIAGSDIQIQVMLDGKLFTANIDTTLEHSTLNTDAAKAVFDVSADSPGSAPAASLTAKNAEANADGVSETVSVFGSRMFAHAFHTLIFGGVTVSDPHFLVRPDLTGSHDPDNRAVTGSHVFSLDDKVMPDVSIGMDVLSKLHLYFAFRERKLYVTTADPVASAAASR